MSTPIERIAGYACEVNKDQWRELVKVADEVKAKIFDRKWPNEPEKRFVSVYSDGDIIKDSFIAKGLTLIPYPDFLAKLKGEEKWEPKNGDEVEVSGNNQDWYQRIFVVSHANMYYCADATDQTSLFAWKHCRPLRPTITRAEAEQIIGKRIVD